MLDLCLVGIGGIRVFLLFSVIFDVVVVFWFLSFLIFLNLMGGRLLLFLYLWWWYDGFVGVVIGGLL